MLASVRPGEVQASLNNVYPHERGVEMLRVIHKVGGPKDGGRSFMDQFRLLVTEVGNAFVDRQSHGPRPAWGSKDASSPRVSLCVNL